METPAPAQVQATAPEAPAAPAAPVTPAAPAAPAKSDGIAPPLTSDKVGDIDSILEAKFNLDPNLPDPTVSRAIAAKLAKGGTVSPAIASLATPAPAAPAAVTAPPAAVTEPPAATDPPAKTEPDARLIARDIPTDQFDDQTQRAMILMRALNEGKKPGTPGYVPLKDCIARIETADTPPAPPPSAASVAVVADKLTKVTTQVVELETKLGEIDARIEEYKANPELYSEELAAANEERTEARFDLKLAQARQQDLQEASQAAAAEQNRGQRHAAIVAAEARYPTLADKKGDLRAIANQITAELKADNHPEHGLLALSSAATIIADRAAQRLATARAQQNGTEFAHELAKLLGRPAAATAPPPAPVVQQEPRKVLPSPGSGGTTPVQPKTPDQKVAEVGDDWKKAEALLDSGNDQYVIR